MTGLGSFWYAENGQLFVLIKALRQPARRRVIIAPTTEPTELPARLLAEAAGWLAVQHHLESARVGRLAEPDWADEYWLGRIEAAQCALGRPPLDAAEVVSHFEVLRDEPEPLGRDEQLVRLVTHPYGLADHLDAALQQRAWELGFEDPEVEVPGEINDLARLFHGLRFSSL